MSDLCAITNSNGTPFNARLVMVGDRYGRDDCLTHGDPMWGRPAQPDALPLVEFYDASQDPAKFGSRGQFVSRYRLDTLADAARDNVGISLCGGVSKWFVDADNVRDVFAWASIAAIARTN